MRSAKPSPFTSPAEATEEPLPSPAATPSSRKPVLPLRLERATEEGNTKGTVTSLTSVTVMATARAALLRLPSEAVTVMS